MAAISPVTPKNFLGAKITNPKIPATKIQAIIAKLNEVSSSEGNLVANSLTELTALSNITANSAIIEKHATSAINATAVATAAEVKTGYITSTSLLPTTITLPTGTLLGASIGAAQGTIHKLYVDNTAGTSIVTIGVAVNGILSALATAAGASFGLLTIPAGITGQAEFTLMFSSSTAYTFSRTA